MKKTTIVIAVFVAVLVISLIATHMPAAAPQSRETFAQKELGMPIQGVGMGPYDNVSVPGASGWMTTERGPKGTAPAESMPTLKFLANAQTSPSCCPSAFTSDSGCLCLSEQDRTVMASRGGNKV